MPMTKKIVFGAGCFWGVQAYFDQVPGVINTNVGYSGGQSDEPTYEQVSSHMTGHAEVIELEYDPELVSTETLVRQFFRMHDPTQLNRQGPDIGDNYRSVIYYTSTEQKKVIEAVIQELTEKRVFSAPIVTEIAPLEKYWPAENYHQKYFEKTGAGMCHIAFTPTDPNVGL